MCEEDPKALIVFSLKNIGSLEGPRKPRFKRRSNSNLRERLEFNVGRIPRIFIASAHALCSRVARRKAGGEAEAFAFDRRVGLSFAACIANAAHKPRDLDRAVGDTFHSRLSRESWGERALLTSAGAETCERGRRSRSTRD